MSEGLQIRGVSKSFGGITVARDLNLDLPPGARTALIGPNGAGKTTFANLLTGVLRPDSGDIFLNGENINRLSEAQRVKAGLAKTFQITNLFRNLTVRENIRLPIVQREERSAGFWRAADTDRGLESEIERTLGAFNLFDFADLKAGELAYGQQRLLELALTLALKPGFLILDEPAAGVPSSDSHLIVQAVHALSPDLAVLIIEHDMKLVFELATRIVVLVNGEILTEGTPDEISCDPQVRKLYLGGRHD
jgi:branched-chain amino acid transport system ATP-binding protein